MEQIEIQISSLNHYCYCPKRAYICYVSQEFIDNEFTIEGRSIHAGVDSGLITKRKQLLQIRSVWLKSEKYGIYDKADMIEENDGKIYPVEYKRGKSNNWKNDQIQLTAQALCLEEMLNLEEKFPLPIFIIIFLITDELRKETIDIIRDTPV